MQAARLPESKAAVKGVAFEAAVMCLHACECSPAEFMLRMHAYVDQLSAVLVRDRDSDRDHDRSGT